MGVTGCQHFILEILTATSAELCFRKLGHSIYHGGFPTLAVHRLCRWCFLFFSSAGTLHPCETSRSPSHLLGAPRYRTVVSSVPICRWAAGEAIVHFATFIRWSGANVSVYRQGM